MSNLTLDWGSKLTTFISIYRKYVLVAKMCRLIYTMPVTSTFSKLSLHLGNREKLVKLKKFVCQQKCDGRFDSVSLSTLFGLYVDTMKTTIIITPNGWRTIHEFIIRNEVYIITTYWVLANPDMRQLGNVFHKVSLMYLQTRNTETCLKKTDTTTYVSL